MNPRDTSHPRDAEVLFRSPSKSPTLTIRSTSGGFPCSTGGGSLGSARPPPTTTENVNGAPSRLLAKLIRSGPPQRSLRTAVLRTSGHRFMQALRWGLVGLLALGQLTLH